MVVNLAQLIVTVIALLLVLTPLLVLVYLAGRRSVATGTHRRFNQIRPDIVLAAGSRQVEFEGDVPNTMQVALLELQQVGSRVVGDGQSPGGTHHSLEGILHDRRLCCISIDENRDGVWLGTVTAELQPGEQRMTGMRGRWSPQSQTLTMRKVTFTRVDSIRDVAE